MITRNEKVFMDEMFVFFTLRFKEPHGLQHLKKLLPLKKTLFGFEVLVRSPLGRWHSAEAESYREGA